MSNDMIAMKAAPSLPTIFTVEDIVAQRGRVQEVMKAVMKEGVHYGTIPGTPKPTLLKPGAEVLCATFRIAPKYKVEEMIDDRGTTRYAVTCLGVHQTTGIELGEGVGECGSDETKYRWRAPVCREEYDETDWDRKRETWAKGKGGKLPYKKFSVMTETADQRNTIRKMAAKRAQIAMTLNVLAASDMFTQDLEDLPPEQLGGDDDGEVSMQTSRSKSGSKAPQQAKPTPQTGKISGEQLKVLRAAMDKAGVDDRWLCVKYNIDVPEDLPFAHLNLAIDAAKAVHSG